MGSAKSVNDIIYYVSNQIALCSGVPESLSSIDIAGHRRSDIKTFYRGFVLSLARDLAAVSTGGHSASVSGVYTFAFGS